MAATNKQMLAAVNCSHVSGNDGNVDGIHAKAGLAYQWPRSQPDYRQILESHKNSGIHGLVYICVVLLIYLLAVSYITVRYLYTRSIRKAFIPFPCFTSKKEQSVVTQPSQITTKAEITATSAVENDLGSGEGVLETEL